MKVRVIKCDYSNNYFRWYHYRVGQIIEVDDVTQYIEALNVIVFTTKETISRLIIKSDCETIDEQRERLIQEICSLE